MVTLYITRREYQAVAEGIEATLQLAIEQKFIFLELFSLFYQGFLRLLNGKMDEGIEQMKRARDGWLSTGLRVMYTHMLGLLAEALGLAGQIEEALQTLEEALTIVNNRDERWFEANLYRIKGDLLQKSGAEASIIEVTLTSKPSPSPNGRRPNRGSCGQRCIWLVCGRIRGNTKRRERFCQKSSTGSRKVLTHLICKRRNRCWKRWLDIFPETCEFPGK